MVRYTHVSRLTALALALGGMLASRAAASGYQLRDQSASGQGNAYAGISAGGSDISSMFFNPATLVRFNDNRLQLGLTEIMPSSRLQNGTATRPGLPPAVGPSTISGPTSSGNIASSATLPILYALWSVSDDFKLGLAVNVPFGLTTEYDPTWAGRYHAIRSHLETVDIAPTLAYRLDERWSVGVALVARRAKAQLSEGIDLGAQAQAQVLGSGLSDTLDGQTIVSAGGADGDATVNGTGWAYGYRLGFLYEPAPTFRMGLGYQSEVRETIKGTATFNTPDLTPAVQALMLANPGKQAEVANLAASWQRAVTDNSVSAVLRMPATLSLGAAWDLSGTFTLASELAWTKWSCFHELRVRFPNPSFQPDNVTVENWKDSWFFAVGGTCHPEGPWTYRLGVALDQTPVPDATRTPRIPDSDRTWLSAGASYQFTKAFGIDAGYSHLFCKDAPVNLSAGNNPANAGQYFDGNLTGTYKNSIDILAIQARLVF